MNEKANSYENALLGLRTAKDLIDRAEIELKRQHDINNALMQQISNMRAAYESLSEAVSGEAKHFQTFSKLPSNREAADRVPQFLTERNGNGSPDSR